MTFATLETSVDSGRPVELLQINYSQQSWYYTTSEVAITYGGQIYVPLPLKTGSSQSTGDASKALRSIMVPADAPVGDLFRVRPPNEIVTIAIFAEHYLDGDFQVTWKGRVTAVDWQGPWLELSCENVFSSLRRIGLRRRYGSQCGHVLYGPKCKLDRAAFKVTGTITVFGGAVLTVSTIASAATDYFAGGYAEWTNNISGALERMMIVTSGAGTVTLSGFPFGLSASMNIDVYPGCDHFLSTCDTKFGNSLNHGGTPFTPQKNPFAGSMIY